LLFDIEIFSFRIKKGPKPGQRFRISYEISGIESKRNREIQPCGTQDSHFVTKCSD